MSAFLRVKSVHPHQLIRTTHPGETPGGSSPGDLGPPLSLGNGRKTALAVVGSGLFPAGTVSILFYSFYPFSGNSPTANTNIPVRDRVKIRCDRGHIPEFPFLFPFSVKLYIDKDGR